MIAFSVPIACPLGDGPKLVPASICRNKGANGRIVPLHIGITLNEKQEYQIEQSKKDTLPRNRSGCFLDIIFTLIMIFLRYHFLFKPTICGASAVIGLDCETWTAAG